MSKNELLLDIIKTIRNAFKTASVNVKVKLIW